LGSGGEHCHRAEEDRERQAGEHENVPPSALVISRV
jgi:hypothetical protein